MRLRPLRPAMHAGLTHQDRDFVQVGPSAIEGIGLFAKRRIPRGSRIIEYTGDQVPIDEPDCQDSGWPRTYRLALDGTTAIDGARNGNEARYVNHCCEPNCETYVFDGRAWLYAIRDIGLGEELTFDYRLAPADPAADLPADLSAYQCRCGAPACRGSLLASRAHQETP